MFGQLPSLFERNFVVGYVLPMIAYISATLGLVVSFAETGWLRQNLFPLEQGKLLLATTIFALLAAFGGVILLSFAREIRALREGYGKLNPAQLLYPFERYRYGVLKSRLSKARSRLTDDIHTDEYDQLGAEYAKLSADKIERFPDEEYLLLPTKFGNIIRAFESYPRVLYGLDPGRGWNRLLGVIPADYRAVVDSAKVYTDFWVNLWFLSILLLLQYIILVAFVGPLKLLWAPLIVILVVLGSAVRATRAAQEWGDLVKASFDIFLPKLREQLELPAPTSIEEEKMVWRVFQQAIIYGTPESIDKLRRLQAEAKESQAKESDAAE